MNLKQEIEALKRIADFYKPKYCFSDNTSFCLLDPSTSFAYQETAQIRRSYEIYLSARKTLKKAKYYNEEYYSNSLTGVLIFKIENLARKDYRKCESGGFVLLNPVEGTKIDLTCLEFLAAEEENAEQKRKSNV